MKIDVERALLRYAKKIKIPITLVNMDTGNSKTLLQQWNPLMLEVSEEISRLSSKDETTIGIESAVIGSWKVQTDGIEATYCLVNPSLPIYLNRNCFLAFNGIYIGTFSFFSSYPRDWFVLINCTRDLVDISVSRESLIDNKKNKDFLNMLFANFIKFLDTIFTRKCNKKLTKSDQSKLYSKIAGRLISDRFIESQENPVFQLISKIEQEKFFLLLDLQGSNFVKGKDLSLEKGISKVYHYLLPRTDCEHQAYQ